MTYVYGKFSLLKKLEMAAVEQYFALIYLAKAGVTCKMQLQMQNFMWQVNK